MNERQLRQLFQNRFNCWTALAGEEHDPDIMAMTEDRFIEVCKELKVLSHIDGHKLNGIEQYALTVLGRAKTDSDGWSLCSPQAWDSVIAGLPDELVDKIELLRKARLTPIGQALLKWCIG